jgi:hypothetical protein
MRDTVEECYIVDISFEKKALVAPYHEFYGAPTEQISNVRRSCEVIYDTSCEREHREFVRLSERSENRHLDTYIVWSPEFEKLINQPLTIINDLTEDNNRLNKELSKLRSEIDKTEYENTNIAHKLLTAQGTSFRLGKKVKTLKLSIMYLITAIPLLSICMYFI